MAWRDKRVSGRSLYDSELMDHSHRLRTMFKNLPRTMRRTIGPGLPDFELESVPADARHRRWKSSRSWLEVELWNEVPPSPERPVPGLAVSRVALEVDA